MNVFVFLIRFTLIRLIQRTFVSSLKDTIDGVIMVRYGSEVSGVWVVVTDPPPPGTVNQTIVVTDPRYSIPL